MAHTPDKLPPDFSSTDKARPPAVRLDRAALDKAVLSDWEAGEQIVDPSAVPPGVLHVLEGQVHLLRLLEQGSRKTLHIMEAGQFILEARYFRPQQRAIAAYASRPTRTAYFPPELVDGLISNNASFRDALLRSLAAKALTAGAEIVDLAHADPALRMLGVLRDLHSREDGGLPARLRLTQAQLAERLGLHPVTVNRTLRRLEETGYLVLGRGVITLLLHRFPPGLPPME